MAPDGPVGIMRRRMWFPTKGALTEAWLNFADNPALIASLMAPEMGQSAIALSGTERKCINEEQSVFATPGASRISRTVLIANLAEAQAASSGNLSCKKLSLVSGKWAARDEGSKLHKCSRRMFNREHFRLVHKTKPSDMEGSSEAGEDLFCTLCEEFGEDNFKRDKLVQEGSTQEFPVELRNGEVVSSVIQSAHLDRIPAVAFDNVFADSSVYDDAVAWLKANREQTISQTG